MCACVANRSRLRDPDSLLSNRRMAKQRGAIAFDAACVSLVIEHVRTRRKARGSKEQRRTSLATAVQPRQRPHFCRPSVAGSRHCRRATLEKKLQDFVTSAIRPRPVAQLAWAHDNVLWLAFCSGNASFGHAARSSCNCGRSHWVSEAIHNLASWTTWATRMLRLR